MNAEHLLTHFDRLTDAPDAIPRLRRFILDLAVRGKLVEQDPEDEPASDLLKRIAAEKRRMVEAVLGGVLGGVLEADGEVAAWSSSRRRAVPAWGGSGSGLAGL